MNLELYRDRALAASKGWGLSDIEWLGDPSTALVGLCNRGKERVVIKAGFYEQLTRQEVATLRSIGPPLMPEVLEFDPVRSVFLMRFVQGETIEGLYGDDDEDLDVWLLAHEKIQGLSLLPPNELPPLSQVTQVFENVMPAADPTIQHIFEVAIANRHYLDEPRKLLHGDLHHFNILREPNGELHIIDPHGAVGNPLYELGACLRNPTPACYEEPGVAERMQRRIRYFSTKLHESELDVARMAFFGCAISLAWDMEDGGQPEEGMLCLCLAVLGLYPALNLAKEQPE